VRHALGGRCQGRRAAGRKRSIASARLPERLVAVVLRRGLELQKGQRRVGGASKGGKTPICSFDVLPVPTGRVAPPPPPPAAPPRAARRPRPAPLDLELGGHRRRDLAIDRSPSIRSQARAPTPLRPISSRPSTLSSTVSRRQSAGHGQRCSTAVRRDHASFLEEGQEPAARDSRRSPPRCACRWPRPSPAPPIQRRASTGSAPRVRAARAPRAQPPAAAPPRPADQPRQQRPLYAPAPVGRGVPGGAVRHLHRDGLVARPAQRPAAVPAPVPEAPHGATPPGRGPCRSRICCRGSGWENETDHGVDGQEPRVADEGRAPSRGHIHRAPGPKVAMAPARRASGSTTG
jgi:hypothetical protein